MSMYKSFSIYKSTFIGLYKLPVEIFLTRMKLKSLKWAKSICCIYNLLINKIDFYRIGKSDVYRKGKIDIP